VLARAYLSWGLAELGEFAEGIARAEEAVQLAEMVDQPWDRFMAYWGVGLVRLFKGNFDAALPLLERSNAICQAGDFPRMAPNIASHLGYAYAMSGDIAAAVQLLEQAVELPVTMRTVHQARVVSYLGEAYLHAGRIDDALDRAQHALGLCRSRRERGYEAWTLRLLGEIASHRDPLEEGNAESGEAHYREALALADELSMRPLVAHCHFGLGKLYRRTDKRQQAQEHLTTATTMYREMDMTYWLEQARARVEGGDLNRAQLRVMPEAGAIGTQPRITRPRS
jgi:tetratricopeptide (TPR) repeat protein